MNKQEILTEIEELKERLNSLEKMYDSLTSPNKRWRGEKNDNYYFITTGGTINCNAESVVALDDMRYAIGNYFQTKEEAEFEAERLKVVTELREFSTPPTDFDWDNTDKKYTLILESTGVKAKFFYMYQVSDLYFKTREQAENAIKAIGEDRIIKYYFRR